jgi:hypothetical protein
VNALSDARIADFLREHFVATHMKVGTFQIVGGRKVGGNVASYFCLPDGSVVHAVAGPSNGSAFLNEARWAWETRRSALTLSTDLVSGQVDSARLRSEVKKAHQERYFAASVVTQQTQVHWLLATRPLARIDEVYPTVWQEILREKLSGLPVATR